MSLGVVLLVQAHKLTSSQAHKLQGVDRWSSGTRMKKNPMVTKIKPAFKPIGLRIIEKNYKECKIYDLI